MKRWISGGVTFLLICVSTIITEWYNSTKKEEVYEMYQSGYYDTIEQRGSHVEIEKMNLFSPPDNWTKYIIANSCVISVPPTVELRNKDDEYTKQLKNIEWKGFKINDENVVFQQKGLSVNQKSAYNTYCRVIVHIQKGKSGDFLNKNEFEELDLNDIHDFQDIAKQSSSGYEIIGNPTVRWIRIEDTYGIETTYIRKGENNLHTCVSSYYFFNNDKMINVILSYRKEDSETWAEDFSNIIKTFKWNNK